VLKAPHKIAGAALHGRRADSSLSVLVSLKNNAMQSYVAGSGKAGVERDDKDKAPLGLALQYSLDLSGYNQSLLFSFYFNNIVYS
jgi:hypothetical protein